MSASPPRATMEEMDWEAAAPPLPFESFTHHNRLGIFLFSLTRCPAASSEFEEGYQRISGHGGATMAAATSFMESVSEDEIKILHQTTGYSGEFALRLGTNYQGITTTRQ